MAVHLPACRGAAGRGGPRCCAPRHGFLGRFAAAEFGWSHAEERRAPAAARGGTAAAISAASQRPDTPCGPLRLLIGASRSCGGTTASVPITRCAPDVANAPRLRAITASIAALVRSGPTSAASLFRTSCGVDPVPPIPAVITWLICAAVHSLGGIPWRGGHHVALAC